MNPEQWLRMKTVFQEALRFPSEKRTDYLDEACRGAESLRAQVESMLASHEKADSFMEVPTCAGLLDRGFDILPPPRSIGPYRLLQAISSGGMGTVYEAIQENPRRTVAVKVMRRGLASDSMLRRFEYEAQILARLTHPNIAQVIEAGTHRDEEGGVPYFVMEYVAGARSITAYTREKQLDLTQRLRLFLEVCDAVYHGHQKGIIHRDLKPSNILVDDTGRVKVIDFGVARATNSDLALTSAHTDVGQLIGTVQYMSPEQCEADPHDLDMRSDVYALGVVLYELLCEELPYDVSKAAIFEATRMIRERNPRKPSSIKRALKGDLETILFTAMEKERTRRYPSALALADDLERYLQGDVILARPAGPATRIYKLVRRNPVVSATLSVAVLALFAVAGYILFISLPGLRYERDLQEQEKKKAVAAEQRAVIARAEAEEEARTTRAINAFLLDMIAAPNYIKDGPEIKVMEVLDRAAENLEVAFEDQPGVAAAMHNTLGWTYSSMRQSEKAEDQFRKSMERCADAFGEEDQRTLKNAMDLANNLRNQGSIQEAEPLCRRIAEACRNRFGDGHESTLAARALLGNLMHRQSRTEEAVSLLRQVLAAQRQLHGDEDNRTVFTVSYLAGALRSQGRYAEALSFQREAVEGMQHLYGTNNPDTLMDMCSLAQLRERLGEEEEAEASYREIMEIGRRVLGESDLVVLKAMSGLAVLLEGKGRIAEAERLFGETLRLAREEVGDEDPLTLGFMNNLGAHLLHQGRIQEAKPLFEEALEGRLLLSGPEHPNTLSVLNNLAHIKNMEGDLVGAEEMHRQILELRRRQAGTEHPETLKSMRSLADVLDRLDRSEECGEILEQVLETSRRTLGEDNPDTLLSQLLLAFQYQKQDRLEEAEELYLKGLAQARARLSPDHRLIALYCDRYGACLTKGKRYAEAEEFLLQGYDLFLRSGGADHIKTLTAADRLIYLYNVWNKPDKLKKWQEILTDR